jgi:hypothetical protein
LASWRKQILTEAGAKAPRARGLGISGMSNFPAGHRQSVSHSVSENGQKGDRY